MDWLPPDTSPSRNVANADPRSSRDLRVIGQASAESEIAGRVQPIDEIQPVPALIRTELDHMTAS